MEIDHVDKPSDCVLVYPRIPTKVRFKESGGGAHNETHQTGLEQHRVLKRKYGVEEVEEIHVEDPDRDEVI